MSETVAVQYLGGADEVHIPQAGASVQRGGTIEVPADLAGRVPGDWHARTDDDPAHWPIRLGADGSTVETHDPGEGLLAQVDLWAKASKPRKGTAGQEN